MTDQTPPPVRTKPSGTRGGRDANAPIIVAALYTAGLLILPFLATLAGAIWAYVARGSADEDWERSVLTYQIRTFWMSMLYAALFYFLAFATMGIGLILYIPLLIWYIVRLVKMWIGATRRETIATEQSWLW
ncbi:MAG: hypothetical protein RIB45_13640 [Marivibrio sp.]|uniref:DUF4870 family protein n=1 Tax=Marivibrio sp. TaxID=2039719 RepID=UPI0032ED84D9